MTEEKRQADIDRACAHVSARRQLKRWAREQAFHLGWSRWSFDASICEKRVRLIRQSIESY